MANKQLTISRAVDQFFPMAKLRTLLPTFSDEERKRFQTTLRAAFYENNDLARCRQEELLARVRDAVELGVTIAGTSPDAHLVPFGTKCSLMVNHKGLLRKAKAAGSIVRHRVGIVYEEDDFSYSLNNGEDSLVHEMNRERDQSKPPTHYYALFWLPDGSKLASVKTRQECERWRDQYSRTSGADTPWNTSFDQMALKTVVRWPFLREGIEIEDPRVREMFVHAGDVIDGEIVGVVTEEPQQIEQQFDSDGLPADVVEKTNEGV